MNPGDKHTVLPRTERGDDTRVLHAQMQPPAHDIAVQLPEYVAVPSHDLGLMVKYGN